MRAFLAKRGIYRTDLAALGLLLLCIASGLRKRDDPEDGAYVRWCEQTWTPGGPGTPDSMLPHFRGTDGKSLEGWDSPVWSGTALPPAWARTGGARAYRSDLQDDWGEPWVGVVHVSATARRLRVISSGPDRQFAWGEGDDLVAWPPARTKRLHVYTPWERWQGTLTCLSFVLLPYLGLRLALPRRSPRVSLEVLRAMGMASGPACALAMILFNSRFADQVPLNPALAVSPRVALLLTGTGLVWGLCFAWRLRRPLPPESAG